MSKQLHIFTPVWGKHFTSLLELALGKSLQWRLNAAAVANCKWTILTTAQEKSEILKTAQKIIPTASITVLTNDRLTEPNAPIGALKMQALLKAIRECLDDKTPMLMSTPDFIWADGSIQNMIDESYPAEGQGLCVSIAHMRALPRFIEALGNNRMSAQSMVEVGLSHAHPAWNRCSINDAQNGIYHAGVSVRYLDCGRLITVQHQMPSPFLVNFKESDLEEFARWKGVTPPAFGEWDHNWPSKLLEEGRLRYIGSSDVAFMVEITEADMNVPPLEPARTPHDQFFRVEPSVKIQKQFISTFRY